VAELVRGGDTEQTEDAIARDRVALTAEDCCLVRSLTQGLSASLCMFVVCYWSRVPSSTRLSSQQGRY